MFLTLIVYVCTLTNNNIINKIINMLPVTCYLIGLSTSINFFIEVFGRAFNVLFGNKVCFEL